MLIPVTDNQVAAASIDGDKDISIQAVSKYITNYVYNTGKKYPLDYHVYSSRGYSGILYLEDAYIVGDGNWYGVYTGYVY